MAQVRYKRNLYIFCQARDVENGYRIFEGRSNMYVTLQTNIEHHKHTSLSKAKVSAVATTMIILLLIA